MKNVGLQKKILYYENSKAIMQELFYEDGFLHNIEGPAMVVYRKDGSKYERQFFIEGYSISKEDFYNLHSLFNNLCFQDIFEIIENSNYYDLRIIFRFAKFYDNQRVLDEVTKKLIVETLTKKN